MLSTRNLDSLRPFFIMPLEDHSTCSLCEETAQSSQSKTELGGLLSETMATARCFGNLSAFSPLAITKSIQM